MSRTGRKLWAVAADPKPAIILCPGSHTPMQPCPQPVLPTGGLTETIYVCETCGTRTKGVINY